MGATSLENVTCSRAPELTGLESAARAEICATSAINIVSTMPTGEKWRGFNMDIIRETPQPNTRRINTAPQAPRLRLSRPMRLEEGMNLAHRQGNPLFGLFPGEDADFRVRREHRAFHGDGVRMSRDIVR